MTRGPSQATYLQTGDGTPFLTLRDLPAGTPSGRAILIVPPFGWDEVASSARAARGPATSPTAAPTCCGSTCPGPATAPAGPATTTSPRAGSRRSASRRARSATGGG